MKIQIPEPKLSRFIFADTRMAWLWLAVRLYVGWQWLSAGLGKIQDPIWVGSSAGGALRGFLIRALEKTSGAHPDVQSWYAAFLEGVVEPNAVIFSNVVAYGEFLVGVALIIGAFTGIAAFFGVFMNASYLFAGTVSSNPVLLILGIFLIMAWRIAGWLGVDRYLLPLLGTPWQKGKAFGGGDKSL
ncbi:MAG TPA: TQO small subunit DoxD [Candidatus Paceibacterota bacterium]|nr:TQO small subunit DoxD [Candidatus Paceibacterota bacterium]